MGVSFRIVTGINAGNENAGKFSLTREEVVKIIREAAIKAEKETGFYVSCSFFPSRTCNKVESDDLEAWEAAYVIVGSQNPMLCPVEGKYRWAVQEFAAALKVALNQSTIAIEFFPVDTVYIR